jgi:hypothetical protein
VPKLNGRVLAWKRISRDEFVSKWERDGIMGGHSRDSNLEGEEQVGKNPITRATWVLVLEQGLLCSSNESSKFWSFQRERIHAAARVGQWPSFVLSKRDNSDAT